MIPLPYIVKRTNNAGEIVSYHGWICTCGRIYGLTDDPELHKIQEISMLRCALDHRGVKNVWMNMAESVWFSFTDKQIKQLAKKILFYNLDLKVPKPPKPPKVVCLGCNHSERFHHVYRWRMEDGSVKEVTYCRIANCKCRHYEREESN